MNNREIRSLTGLRGVAAIFVMCYHFNLSHLLTGGVENFFGHGYLMVDLFFILSGFVIAMTYGHWFSDSMDGKSIANYIVRRFARIYPLYAVMTLTAAILISTGWMDRWPGPEIPVSVVVNFTMLQTIVGIPSLDTPGWSVSAEWIISLLFPILAFLCLKKSWTISIAVMIISFGFFPILTVLPALIDEPKRAGLMDIWHYGTIYPVVRALAGFTIGIVTFRVAKLPKVNVLIDKKWLSIVVLSTIIVSMAIKNADIITLLFFPLLIISICRENNLVSRVLGSAPIYYLGVLSFSIYLIHNQLNYFMLILIHQLQRYGFLEVTATVISLIVFISITIILAACSYKYIEKPARDIIRRASFMPDVAVNLVK
ncbi:acyltransferase [Pectobacteriaceae bacterium CE90]|nr:acyltransferase [Pectobacteriaceae bacterium CE90]